MMNNQFPQGAKQGNGASNGSTVGNPRFPNAAGAAAATFSGPSPGSNGLMVRQMFIGPTNHNFFLFQNPGHYSVNMQVQDPFPNVNRQPAGGQFKRTRQSFETNTVGTNTSPSLFGGRANGGSEPARSAPSPTSSTDGK